MSQQKSIETDDDIEDKVERSMDIQDEIDKIRDKKRQNIIEDFSDESTNKYISGRVKDVKKMNGTIKLKVKYNNNVEWLRLSYPNNSREFTNNCEYVRYLNYTDSVDDNSIIENRIPLKVENGDVVVDLPENMSVISLIKYKLRRNTNIDRSIFDVARFGAGTALFTMVTLPILIQAYNSVGAEFLIDNFLGGFMSIILSFPVIFGFMHLLNIKEIKNDGIATSYIAFTFLTLILTTISGGSMVYIESGVGFQDTFYSLVNYMTVTYSLIGSSVLIATSANKLKDKCLEKLKYYKKKYLLWSKDPSYIE